MTNTLKVAKPGTIRAKWAEIMLANRDKSKAEVVALMAAVNGSNPKAIKSSYDWMIRNGYGVSDTYTPSAPVPRKAVAAPADPKAELAARAEALKAAYEAVAA